MADTACNFALSSTFNAKYDITWSFQFSLCGYPGCHGGFATFLYDADVPQLIGGGIRSSLGFAKYEELTLLGSTRYPGVSGSIVGAGFDSSGLFSSRQYGLVTGAQNSVPNSYAVRVGDEFTAVGYGVLPFSVMSQQDAYTAMRFNLTDMGQTLNIDYKENIASPFSRIASIDTGLLYIEDTYCNIGISFASPTSGDLGAVFKIKNIHTHGVS